MDEDDALPAGSVVGRYRIVRLIGRGGMGLVHEAVDLRLGGRVALKLMAPHLAEDPVSRGRFVREARSLAAVDCPHVVRVHAHGEADGRLYLATELLPDGDLGRLLRREGRLPAATALDVLAQVAAGLAAVHAAGLVHRDVKPANVLLRRHGSALRACLGDLGVAHPLESEVVPTGTAGTPPYMAPELHLGAPAGVRSDVYSVGCVLWAALTGRPPYPGGTDGQPTSAHLTQPVPRLEGLDPLTLEVNRVLRRALAKDPVDRYASASTLRDDLARLVHRPAELGAVGPTGVPARSPRRTAPAAVAAAAVVAGLACVGSAEVLAGDRSQRVGAPQLMVSDRGRDVAVDSMAASLGRRGALTPRQSRCVADRWVEGAGLRSLARAGYFDDDLEYVDLAGSALTRRIEDAAEVAAIECSDR